MAKRVKWSYHFGPALVSLTCGLLLFLFFSGFWQNPRQVEASKSTEEGIQEVTSSALATLPTPAATPTPIPSEEPEPNYTGYCLNVPVIFYHHVQPMAEAQAQWHAQFTVDSGVFDAQMAYLVGQGYTPISAKQLADVLINKRGLPSKPVVVTIDDGYEDIYKYAYPIIQKYGIQISLAISTGLLNNPNYMSWDQLKQMAGSGNVTFYNHSWSHANIAGVSRDKALYEVSTAKKQLSEYLDSNNNVFFYPYGGINNVATDVLRENEYAVGFSTLPGTIQCDSFLMSLHRTRIGNSALSSYGL